MCSVLFFLDRGEVLGGSSPVVALNSAHGSAIDLVCDRIQLPFMSRSTSTTGKPSSRATWTRCVRYKITLPRSQSLQVPGSTRNTWAAYRIDQPMALRLASRRSDRVFGAGKGS